MAGPKASRRAVAPWRVLVPVTALLAGLLFATTAATGRNALRPAA